LADKKLLKEFTVRKYNDAMQWSPSFNSNRFAIEIDGEIYKLNNKPENDLIVRVEHIEKCINLIKHDPNESLRIKVSYLPNVYLTSKQAFDKFFKPQQALNEQEMKKEIEMPSVLPFENLYLKYWMPLAVADAAKTN
jgi:hypothetical protein